jgi:inorganic pyrophosphatase
MAAVDVGVIVTLLAIAAMFGTRFSLEGTPPFSEIVIVGCCFVGLAFAYFLFGFIRKITLPYTGLVAQGGREPEGEELVPAVYKLIMDGAVTFLKEEYKIAGLFCFFFGLLLFGFVSWGSSVSKASSKTQPEAWVIGLSTAVAFWVGAATSMACGYLGMMIATYSNARTTVCAATDAKDSSVSVYTNAFNTAFRGGGVMGYALCSIGVMVLWILLTIYKTKIFDTEHDLALMMDCVAGYGLGGSTVAMFGRVGGGIYTKAADVGADLCGKVVAGLEEDDIKNPATIADNVGDNVGDIAGMGADLFGSFAESTCASLVIAATAIQSAENPVEKPWELLMFPIAISASGIVVCAICSFVATDVWKVTSQAKIEIVLKVQMVLTAVMMLFAIGGLATTMMPEEGFELTTVNGKSLKVTAFKAWLCAMMGTFGGLFIGLITEYFTSHSYTPTRELATACKSGTAVNIIFGMALGYKSCIIPVFLLASAIYVSFIQADLYGIALAALGMLSTLATGLTIDGFGPISDNAGGIAEMAYDDRPEVREATDALDAAGNTTAAIGKGFAIGSAALVSLALFGAFVTRCSGVLGEVTVNILDPTTFAAGLIGSMIPYWFAALTMKSVGQAARGMVEEVKRQFKAKDSNGRTLLDKGTTLKPDYEKCIMISTQASLKEMLMPGALVIGSPLIFGAIFGVHAVFGLLTGSLFSSVQLAISMSNSGGAWDNTKKYIKGGFAMLPDGVTQDMELYYSKSRPDAGKSESFKIAKDAHDAAVQGDTVGDPFKDTSGPALNIVMKLQAIVSLVFAQFFLSINDGKGLISL